MRAPRRDASPSSSRSKRRSALAVTVVADPTATDQRSRQHDRREHAGRRSGQTFSGMRSPATGWCSTTGSRIESSRSRECSCAHGVLHARRAEDATDGDVVDVRRRRDRDCDTRAVRPVRRRAASSALNAGDAPGGHETTLPKPVDDVEGCPGEDHQPARWDRRRRASSGRTCAPCRTRSRRWSSTAIGGDGSCDNGMITSIDGLAGTLMWTPCPPGPAALAHRPAGPGRR